MLICLNCGTTNDDTAIACSHCRLKGKFKKQETPNAPTVTKNQTPDALDKLSCTNCGEPLSENASRCGTCQLLVKKRRFPIDLLGNENGLLKTIHSLPSHRTRLFFN